MRKLNIYHWQSKRSCQKKVCVARLLSLSVISMLVLLNPPANAAEKTDMRSDELWEIPTSAFLSEDTRSAKEKAVNELLALISKWNDDCGAVSTGLLKDLPAIRSCRARVYYDSPGYAELKSQYAVDIEAKTIGGVVTEIYTPAEGISAKNKKRVLINLHGGSFMYGSRTNSHYASIPIAAGGKIKVISVDYRMAPEHRFPAATEDVLAVYKVLLKDYKPENIGIYGCSAGGLLAAQSIARFQRDGLPLPGAIAMLCAGASADDQGDSIHFGAAMSGIAPRRLNDYLYFENADRNSPLVFPAQSDHLMSNFPPSLLISSTRDFLLSSVVTTHAQLVRLGVEADLHVLEGLEHAFWAFTDLSESRQVHSLIIRFFDKHLDE